MSRGPKAKYGPKRLAALEKQTAALNLLAAGCTYSEIARRVGYYDASGARKACDTLLTRAKLETTDHFLKLQDIRYRQLLVAVWPRAMAADHDAFGDAIKALQAMERIRGIGTGGVANLLVMGDAQVNAGNKVQAFQWQIPESEAGRAELADRLRGLVAIAGGASEEGPGLPG